MKNNDVITVVVPIYNAGRYLAKCIESVIEQTYTMWELILVDDGSTDDSASICDKYSAMDQRIKVLHKKNTGVSDTRNTGIQMATGSYFTCLDADDWLDKEFLKCMLMAMKKNNADVVACGFAKHFEAENKSKEIIITNEKRSYSSKEALDCACDLDCPWVGFAWGKLYRKEIIDTYGIMYNKEISICEDSLFNYYYMTKINKAIVLPNILYNYLIRASSATNMATKNLESLKTMIKSFEEALKIADNYPGSKFKKRIVNRLIDAEILYISSMFKNGGYDKAAIEIARTKLKLLEREADKKQLENNLKIKMQIIIYMPYALFLILK